MSTLTITSEPADWRGAVGVAVQEMRRMQRHGLTPGELDRYRQAILRDSAQLAEQVCVGGGGGVLVARDARGRGVKRAAPDGWVWRHQAGVRDPCAKRAHALSRRGVQAVEWGI